MRDKFFTVWTRKDVESFTLTQRKKFFLIYSLFVQKTELNNKVSPAS